MKVHTSSRTSWRERKNASVSATSTTTNGKKKLWSWKVNCTTTRNTATTRSFSRTLLLPSISSCIKTGQDYSPTYTLRFQTITNSGEKTTGSKNWKSVRRVVLESRSKTPKLTGRKTTGTTPNSYSTSMKSLNAANSGLKARRKKDCGTENTKTDTCLSSLGAEDSKTGTTVGTTRSKPLTEKKSRSKVRGAAGPEQ